MNYIVTFYAHFGAVRFKRYCDQKKRAAQLMPVPRSLSSSCGTCVQYSGEYLPFEETYQDEIEQIVEVHGESYQIVYQAENS